MKTWTFGGLMLTGGLIIGISSTLALNQFNKEKPQTQQQEPKLADDIFNNSIFNSDPFEAMKEMRKEMFNRFNDSDSIWSYSKFSFNNSNITDIGIQTKENENYLAYEVTGKDIDKKSLSVEVSDGMLTISGKVVTKSDTQDESSAGHFQMSSSFSRSFSVPKYVNPTDVEMDHKENKIIITFPKRKSDA